MFHFPFEQESGYADREWSNYHSSLLKCELEANTVQIKTMVSNNIVSFLMNLEWI